jgi:hypothetical protein
MALRRLTQQRALFAALLLLLALAVLPGLASAAPGQVVKLDPTGAVFTCAGGTTYTVTGGTLIFVLHESTDANGGQHVTGTNAPTGVTLLGSDGLTYTLAGAAWFGGNLNANGASGFTDTEYFNIIAPGGGVVAKVSIVSHITFQPDGSVSVEFEKNRGECVAPEG